MSGVRALPSHLRADATGGALLETALAAPILLGMLLGLVDYTMAFAYRLEVQQHAQTGVDLVVASEETPPTDAAIRTQVSAVSGLPTSAVVVTRWTECDYVSIGAIGACPNPAQDRANYLRVTVTGHFEPILPSPGFVALVPSGPIAASATARIPQ